MRLWPAFFLAWTVGCSGSGVSTTARTTGESQEGSVGDGDGDGGADDADDGSEDSADPSGADDEGPVEDEGASDPSAGDDGSSEGDEGVDPDTGGEAIGIAGTWLSEGEDIAPILVELTGAQSITATFTADSFTVVTIDDEGQEVQQVGVFMAEPSGFGEIYDIVLQQTMPTAITVEGIFEIDESMSPPVMRYEVVQTMPSVGAVPPTAEGGFGSTTYRGDLTQVFRRQ